MEGLRFAYPLQPALFTGWSTRIPPGVSLVRGNESSGKSTLLRLLAGDLAAKAGQLQVDGIPLSTQPAAYRQQVFWTDPRARTDLELLFQLDSDDGVMWGDCGVGNFFITDADLKRRDFSRVLYNWDCC